MPDLHSNTGERMNVQKKSRHELTRIRTRILTNYFLWNLSGRHSCPVPEQIDRPKYFQDHPGKVAQPQGMVVVGAATDHILVHIDEKYNGHYDSQAKPAREKGAPAEEDKRRDHGQDDRYALFHVKVFQP